MKETPLDDSRLMRTSPPNLLRENDGFSVGQQANPLAGVQINALLQIRFICQLAAIEGFFRPRIEEIEAVRFFQRGLPEAIGCHLFPNRIRFGFCLSAKWICHAMQNIQERAALGHHGHGIPGVAGHLKFDHPPARPGLNASAGWPDIDDDVIHLAGDRWLMEEHSFTNGGIFLIFSERLTVFTPYYVQTAILH